ncbi:urea ABC transporter substrate-binding protein [Paenibacillus radicis (ex Xue et al. 2023)]|uniref:Urea ABC transporter substrate-binding protein n=1 Tax=Paenibacillus radicis (ex Xue et al. 2023) TaxID=2972489 RepID=A0ABT1Y9R1_9BACL|nr:urea ABC transporter substrate-binding protein [Paenibacillus radicis (ex Xue et al. 2023)]MCR8629929.1 urea ABC transporter substrate-binding protein [Paenibacillus radicis (ex Xue et al. 2023)]
MLAKRKGIQVLMAVCMSLTALLAGCATQTTPAATPAAPAAATKTDAKPEAGKDEAIPVGILHSLTGTMSISEVSVKDAEMMAIDEINKAGGVLGKQLKPIVEDGASDWPTFAEKTKKLLQKDKTAVIFGGWTSSSRKAVLPVVEQNKGLFFYPVQYEGLESSPYIFYTGATTNQQIVPAVTWLLQNKGKKFFLLGSDYVFPRTANKIIKEQLKAEGGQLIAEEYTPLGHTDYNTIISKIKKDKPNVIFNTLNGDSNVAFFKQLKDAGISAKDLTTLSVSIAEEEIRGIGASVLEGHYAAWNYYQTTDTPENKKFVDAYKAKYGKDRVTDDPIEAGYFGVYLWAEAVKKAGSFDVEKVKEAAKGLEYNAPGGKVMIDGENQHVYKTVRIGQVQADGQFKEVWNSGKPVKPDPFLKTYPWGAEVTKK